MREATLLDLDVPLPLVGTTPDFRRRVRIVLRLRARGGTYCGCHGFTDGCPNHAYPDLSEFLEHAKKMEAWANAGRG